MKYIIYIVSLCAVLGLTGCVTPNGMSNQEKNEAYQAYIESAQLPELDKISAFRFNGWASLSDKHLIIYKTHNKPYLITLNRSCYDLDFATAIKVHTKGSSLHTKFDAISVPSDIEVKCFIKSIHQLTKEQKQALFDIGKVDEEKKQAELEESKQEKTI